MRESPKLTLTRHKLKESYTNVENDRFWRRLDCFNRSPIMSTVQEVRTLSIDHGCFVLHFEPSDCHAGSRWSFIVPLKLDTGYLMRRLCNCAVKRLFHKMVHVNRHDQESLPQDFTVAHRIGRENLNSKTEHPR